MKRKKEVAESKRNRKTNSCRSKENYRIALIFRRSKFLRIAVFDNFVFKKFVNTL